MEELNTNNHTEIDPKTLKNGQRMARYILRRAQKGKTQVGAFTGTTDKVRQFLAAPAGKAHGEEVISVAHQILAEKGVEATFVDTYHGGLDADSHQSAIVTSVDGNPTGATVPPEKSLEATSGAYSVRVHKFGEE